MLKRCDWAGPDPIYLAYHDTEWGVPLREDRDLFEFLILEGAQAGLSWITILKRRDGYRRAFENFDVERVARFSPKKIEKLLQDTGIIRNRLKVISAVKNAQAFLKVQEEFGSFSKYQWDWVAGQPIQNAWDHIKSVPPKTDLSDRWSKDLKCRGFNFCGSTILYAHMQAVGMVNDHLTTCFRYQQVKRLKGVKTL